MRCNLLLSFFTALLLVAAHADAGDLHGRVTDVSGAPVANAVIALYGVETSAASTPSEAVMDQRGRQFEPHVLVIQRNTPVRFPNSDDIRHQVYSFSPAKTFNLPLYHGVPTQPISFDKAGEVVLGCNIHDRMLGYIYVVDTSWFAKSDDKGALQIANVPAGNYRVQLWYPGLNEAAQPVEQTVQMPAQGAVNILFTNAVREILPEPEPATTKGWGERRGLRN